MGGGSSKFDGRGLSQYMEGGWGGDLKCCQKIPVKEFEFAGYKPANVLKMKFTHCSRILARF